jgi:hypothetical protein
VPAMKFYFPFYSSETGATVGELIAIVKASAEIVCSQNYYSQNYCSQNY